MKRTAKVRKPTEHQAQILRMIAQSMLIKTRLPSRDIPVWTVDGYGEIPHECAQALIRNGWVTAQRDGLSMFDESQTYKALKP
jgi:hypothetical protein